ncbi:MAG: MAPEG family protein [Candidatus Sericytochromatia bacterium]
MPTPELAQSVTQTLALNPVALKVLGACTAVLFFKMFAIGLTQGLVRNKNKVYTNPEDAALIGKTAPAAAEHPDYIRASNAYRNDFENIPIFLGLAWAALHLHAADGLAPIYFGLFTAARVGHTFFYIKGLQPWRSLAFAGGLMVNLALAFHILMAALR